MREIPNPKIQTKLKGHQVREVQNHWIQTELTNQGREIPNQLTQTEHLNHLRRWNAIGRHWKER